MDETTMKFEKKRKRYCLIYSAISIVLTFGVFFTGACNDIFTAAILIYIFLSAQLMRFFITYVYHLKKIINDLEVEE